MWTPYYSTLFINRRVSLGVVGNQTGAKNQPPMKENRLVDSYGPDNLGPLTLLLENGLDATNLWIHPCRILKQIPAAGRSPTNKTSTPRLCRLGFQGADQNVPLAIAGEEVRESKAA